MKKALALVMSLLLLTAPLMGLADAGNVNPEGFPLVKEPITLKIFGQQHPLHADWPTMDVFVAYQEMTGIKLDFDVVPTQGYDEKKYLLFASGEYPDIFVRAQLTNPDIVKYGVAGVLLPLEDLIPLYAPNYYRHMQETPAIATRITSPDGHIYALSDIITQTAARGEKFWINKTWLDKAGKPVPTTVQELEDVLRAFVALDYDGNGIKDEIGFSSWDLPSVVKNLCGVWGLQMQFGEWFFNVSEDGQVDCWLDDDRFKDLLQWLNRMYAEGLLDPEIFVQDSAKYNAKMAGHRMGLFFNQADDVFGGTDYIGIAPFAGKSEHIYVKSQPVARGNGVFAISTTCENPEAALRWVDTFYSEEGSTFLRFGIEGKTWNRGADGKPMYVDGILNSPNGSGAEIAKFTFWPGGGAPQWLNLDNSIAVASPSTVAAQQALEPFIPPNIYPEPLFDEATIDRLLVLQGDIEKYFKESIAKFVKGDLSFDKWDEYLSTLNKMGLSEWEAVYQASLDALK